MNESIITMGFKFEDLEQVPLPTGRRGGNRVNKHISLSRNALYFSNYIVKDLGLKYHDRCNLKMLPNNKGFVLLLGADGFLFTNGGTNGKGKVCGLAISGKNMADYFRERFKTTKFDYNKIGDDLIYITPIQEEQEGK